MRVARKVRNFMEEKKMTLEEQIRNCRKQAGISQEKMAELIGV